MKNSFFDSLFLVNFRFSRRIFCMFSEIYHVKLYIVEKLGFGTAPKQCGIHSKPQSLMQKTFLLITSKTLTAYAGLCLCMHVLDLRMHTHVYVHRPRVFLTFIFKK